MGFAEKFRASRFNHWLQRILRTFQFLSAVVSLGLFSSRLAYVLKLARRASHSNGAVEGILVAATIYTLISLILTFALKKAAPKLVRWALVILDLIFLAAFIVVAVLTRPGGGSSGPCKDRRVHGVNVPVPNGSNCNLPWGVFFLAILSTILHLLTALFQEARDHHKAKKASRNGSDDEPTMQQHGRHEPAMQHQGRYEPAMQQNGRY